MVDKSTSCCGTEAESVAEQRRFLAAVLEVGELAHTADSDEEFYQRLLELAVEVIPGAEGGSVQLAIESTTSFRFVAAVGYDLSELQRHTLDREHFFRDADTPEAEIVHEFRVDSRSAEIADWLETVGRLSEIKANVSAPVIVDDRAVAFFSLDSFSNENAFDATSLEMVTVLSRFIGDLYVRRALEAALLAERESLRHLATHDSLTGLANRRFVESRLQSSVATAQGAGRPSAVFFLDMDNFKSVNDTRGHDFGDRVLCEVGATISGALRDADLVGRWGGDEFVVLPARVESDAEASLLAERILAAFEQPLDLGEGTLQRVSISIGVSWSLDSSASVRELLRTADDALYEAKTEGGKSGVRLRKA